jgi:hypothetical protein
MTSRVAPLQFNVPIVYPTGHPQAGCPTPEFQAMIQQWLIEKADTDSLAESAVQTGRQIISGGGLTGGGDLSANRTLAVGAGTGITVNADDVAIDLTAEAERIRDVIGTALVAGSNITITVNDAGDTITVAASGGGPAAYTEPSAADFGTSRSAGGSPSLTDPSGQNGILMQTTRSASRQYSFYLKSAGLSAPFTVEAMIYAQYEVDDPFWWCGIAVGDTSANQHAYIALMSNATGIAGPQLQSGYVSSLTAAETLNVALATPSFARALLRIVVSTSDLKFYWSPDNLGLHWHLLNTITISGNFTNGVTKVGLFQGYTSSSGTNRMWCPHFNVF